jgi:hypothetical protein
MRHAEGTSATLTAAPGLPLSRTHTTLNHPLRGTRRISWAPFRLANDSAGDNAVDGTHQRAKGIVKPTGGNEL